MGAGMTATLLVFTALESRTGLGIQEVFHKYMLDGGELYFQLLDVGPTSCFQASNFSLCLSFLIKV